MPPGPAAEGAHARGARQVAEVTLEPRSACVLAGADRVAWEHSIPATKALHYSITFRTLKAWAKATSDPPPYSELNEPG